MTEGLEFLPMHIAVHYLTCAVASDGAFAMNHDAGRVVEQLAERVERVTVLAYEPPAEPVSDEDATPFGVRPRRGNVSLLSLGPKGTWRDHRRRNERVARIVAAASPAWDLLLLRLVNRRAAAVWRSNRCPRVIAHVGGSMLEYRKHAPQSFGRRLTGLALAAAEEYHQRRIIGDVDLTFVVGEDLRDRYASVSDNVIVLRESGLHDDDLSEAQDRLTSDAARFLIVGQVHASKGVFEALRAFARIRHELIHQAHLDVIGTGVALDDLRRSARELGVDEAVTFHGWVGGHRELFELYRQSDVLFCVSHVDFLPRVTWEAMGSSVLVIATRVGALPHVFTDGEHVVFVPAGSVDAIFDAVVRLRHQTGPRRHILSRALDHAREATLEHMIDRLLHEVTARWPELSESGR